MKPHADTRVRYGDRITDEKDGWKADLFRWQAKWGDTIQLAIGVVAVCTAVGLLALAGLYYSSENDRERRNQDTARIAKAACIRTRLIGPPLVDAYEKYRILSPKVIKVARASIPEKC